MIVTMMAVTATFAAPAMADDNQDFIEQIQDYLELSEQYVALAKQKENAVFFAIEGIVEIHQERGEQAKAVPSLRKVLEQFPDNQAVRNIIHLKLRDLLRETGQADLALVQLETLIAENR